jgi:hypothetical protein
MFKTRKILAIILAALMVLPAAACATDGDKDGKNPASTAGEAETKHELFPDFEKQDYKGATFCMSGAKEDGSWYLADEYKTGGENIHVLNNTLFEMNTLVEEYLNIEFVMPSTAGVPLETSIMSGDDIYQVHLPHAYWYVAPYINRNFVLDMNELDNLDFDQPYWNGPIIEELSIADHKYVAVGDICWSVLHMIYTNKDLMANANLKMPYDMVRNGQWTFAEFFNITSNLYQDNGDGTKNPEDIFGFAGGLNDWGAVLPQAAGIFVASKNENGGFDLSFYNERTVNLFDQFLTWTQDESVQVWTSGKEAGKSVDFASQQSYMHGGILGTQYLNVDFEVGILPLPKYDVAQENYSHVNWGHELLVPTTVKNREMVGHVLELMAFYSGTMVREKYYDEVLQLRVSEQPDDRDMVEIIYSTVVYDPGMVYAHAGNDTGSLYPLSYTFHNCIGDSKNIASYCQAYLRSGQKQLNALVKKVSQR